MKVVLVFGTRPEAIKLAPVLHALRRRAGRSGLRVVVCATAQHRQMLDEALALFGVSVDYDLNLMKPDQSLTQLMSAVLAGLEPVLRIERPDWVLVQGDTATAAGAALAAFYARVRIGHVEAGLRTYDNANPFPEEFNRRMIGLLADLCFAPTSRAAAQLLQEGVPPERIVITGNTVIDALRWAVDQPLARNPLPETVMKLLMQPSGEQAKIALVTVHRRETFGAPLEQICHAIRDLARAYPELRIVFLAHPNPNVRRPVLRLLNAVPNVTLAGSLNYVALVHLLTRVYLVLTDSGGLQEEAPSLGKPVLVLRDVTERPEAVEAGSAKLVGTSRQRIVHETACLLEGGAPYLRMCVRRDVYGDGKASQRIAEALLSWQHTVRAPSPALSGACALPC